MYNKNSNQLLCCFSVKCMFTIFKLLILYRVFEYVNQLVLLRLTLELLVFVFSVMMYTTIKCYNNKFRAK